MKITKTKLRQLIKEEIKLLQEGSQDPRGLPELLASLNVTGRAYDALANTLSTAFYEYEEDAAGMEEEVENLSGGHVDSSGDPIRWPLETYEKIYQLYSTAEKGYKDPYQRGVQI